MISTDGGIAAQLVPLDSSLFNCFDQIDDDDSRNDKPKKPETIFDGTSYGSDTFEEPEIAKPKKAATKPAKNAAAVIEPLDNKLSDTQRVDFYTRPYEPTGFDNGPRPQWTSPRAANDNQKRKHSFPALDEARNNTLMAGRDGADTIIQNEWAFDILLEVKGLMEAAAPAPAWLQHNGHGETDEHTVEDNANPGYGLDLVHDYGPSEDKVKLLWEHGNDNEPSMDGSWKLGIPDSPDINSASKHLTNTVMVSPATGKPRRARLLHRVGALEINERNHVTHFTDKNGKRLKFKTTTRRVKGERSQPKVIPDPVSTGAYNGAVLPRNKRGELNVGFFGGKTASSNCVKPGTMHHASDIGTLHSSNDPWAAQIAAENARNAATIKLSQCRLLVGDQPYDALTQAASGIRIGELCGGRLGNTTDSAKGRNLLQVAIERIIEARTASGNQLASLTFLPSR
jgi:hypothetical protein